MVSKVGVVSGKVFGKRNTPRMNRDVHPVKETMKKHKIFRDRQHSCRSFFMQREKGHVSQKE